MPLSLSERASLLIAQNDPRPAFLHSYFVPLKLSILARIGVFSGRWRRFIPIPQKQDRHNPPRRFTETLYLFRPQRPSPFAVSLSPAVRLRSGVGAASQTRPSFRWASRSRWRANVSRD